MEGVRPAPLDQLAFERVLEPPQRPGSRPAEAVFFEKLDDALRVLKRFQPDALVLALGFDIYKDDPQAQVAVTTEGFGKLGEAIGALGLPSVIVQEGGYPWKVSWRMRGRFLAASGKR